MADPSTIPDLTAFWRAEAITGVADGGAVNTWPDSSGNGYTMQNSGGSGAGTVPTFAAAALKGKPGVRFARASEQFLFAASAPSGGAAQTIFAVLVPTATGAGSTTNTYRGAGGNGGLQAKLAAGKPAHTAQYVAELGAATSAVTAAPLVLISTYSATAGSTWRLNGTPIGTSSTARALTAQGSVLGKNGSGSGEAFDGLIVQVRQFARVLTAAEQAVLDSYAQDTYGITVSDYTPDSKQISYSGTGTLTATGQPAGSGPAAYSSTGTLSDTAQPAIVTSAGYGGTGSLTATPAVATSGPAAYTGSGALATASSAAMGASISYSGAGVLAAAARPVGQAATSYSGAGTLTAAVVVIVNKVRLGTTPVRAAWWGTQRVRRIGYGSQVITV